MMTFSFPFGQYQEKKTLLVMWPHMFLATRFFKLCCFNKNSQSCMLKNTFPPILVKKKKSEQKILNFYLYKPKSSSLSKGLKQI